MRFHCEWVKTKIGGYAKIRYWQNKHNKVLPRSEHPNFLSKGEADVWCKQQNTKREQHKLIARHEALNDIDFKNDLIGDWTSIIDEFVQWHQTTAKYSHDSARPWLKNYVIPFYLEKKAGFHLWPEYYDEFRETLLSARSDKTGRKLTYSSRNHIIKYLNLFLSFVKEKKKLIGSFDKCKYFPKSLLNSRGVESIISPEEIENLRMQLENPSLEFLYVLIHTGLRLNELFSCQAVNVESDLSRLKPLILKPFYWSAVVELEANQHR